MFSIPSSVNWAALAKAAAVIAVLTIAAVLASPKGKLPIALKGLKKILRDETGNKENESAPEVWKRILAFVLTAIAVLLVLGFGEFFPQTLED